MGDGRVYGVRRSTRREGLALGAGGEQCEWEYKM